MTRRQRATAAAAAPHARGSSWGGTWKHPGLRPITHPRNVGAWGRAVTPSRLIGGGAEAETVAYPRGAPFESPSKEQLRAAGPGDRDTFVPLALSTAQNGWCDVVGSCTDASLLAFADLNADTRLRPAEKKKKQEPSGAENRPALGGLGWQKLRSRVREVRSAARRDLQGIVETWIEREQRTAALKVQARCRGNKGRAEAALRRQERTDAAVVMQRMWRKRQVGAPLLRQAVRAAVLAPTQDAKQRINTK